MYLNKEGCEYYEKILKEAIAYCEAKLNKLDSKGDLPNQLVIEFNNIKMADVLTELLSHVDNILSNIKSEKDILKEFIKKIDPDLDIGTGYNKNIMGIEVYFQENFETLKKEISNCLNRCNHPEWINAKIIVYNYKNILLFLKEVRKESSTVAIMINTLIRNHNKEEELRKDNELLEIYEKNIVSWFK